MKSTVDKVNYLNTLYIYIYIYINIYKQRVSDFLFIPLRPFFYAAIAKRWKVQFRNGLR